jgi:hypothetical protein
MAHAQPSPKPSPNGPTTRDVLFEPPPVRKPAARRLHELQDPTSPIKACKFFRTDSTIDLAAINMPPIDIGESVLAVPDDLNSMSFMLDPKEFDEVTTLMYDVKDKAPKNPYSSTFEFDDPGGTSSNAPNAPLMRTSRKKAREPKQPKIICLDDILNPTATTQSAPADKKTPPPSKRKCARISQSHDNVFGEDSSSDSDDDDQ